MRSKLQRFFLLIWLCLLCLFQTACALVEPDTPVLLALEAGRYVRLYDYQNITVDSSELELTQDEMDAIIMADISLSGTYKTVEDRASPMEDDIAVLDITASADNEVFLEDDRYDYVVGSEELSGSFDDRLKEMTVGERADFSVRLADDLQYPELAGEIADCVVTLVEIKAFITMDDTREIQEYYGLNSMDEVYRHIEGEARQTMIFDYAYNLTLDRSLIDAMPDEGEEYISSVIKRYEQAAEDCGMALDEYLKTEFDTTFDVLRGETEGYFREFMVLKAITEREDMKYTKEDYDDHLHTLAVGAGISLSDVKAAFEPLDVIYDMLYDDVREILLKYAVVK